MMTSANLLEEDYLELEKLATRLDYKEVATLLKGRRDADISLVALQALVKKARHEQTPSTSAYLR